MKQEVYDARNREHITADGGTLRTLIKNRIATLLDARTAVLSRMNNEIVDKAEAVTMLVALQQGRTDLNERALFIQACAKRAAYLESEVEMLNTLGTTFAAGREYRISLDDAIRIGI